MKVLKRCGVVLIYILLVLILFYQVMGMVGVGLSNVPALVEAAWLIPTWVAMVVLLAAALVLYKVGKEKEILPLCAMGAGIIGAVMALVIALTLQAALPLQVSATNISATGEQGLDGWKLISRHYSPMIVGLVVAVMSFVTYKQNRDERISKENSAYEEQFALNGEEWVPGEQSQKRGKKQTKRQRQER